MQMADMNQNTSNTAPQKASASSVWTDLGPVIAYVLVFNIARRMIDKTQDFNLLGMSVPGQDAALYIGTLVFAIAIIISVIYSKLKTGKVSIMLWVTAVIAVPRPDVMMEPLPLRRRFALAAETASERKREKRQCSGSVLTEADRCDQASVKRS